MIKEITTEEGEYKVSSLYPPRKKTAVFNCEDNCFRCQTKCDIGILNYELSNKALGD